MKSPSAQGWPQHRPSDLRLGAWTLPGVGVVVMLREWGVPGKIDLDH